MSFVRFVAACLGVWRATHLLQAEDGPGGVVVRLRQRAGQGFWGSLMDCFYCLSLWTAAPFAAATGRSWRDRLVLWPALSAGAILVQRLIEGPQPVAASAYVEDEEEEGALLREAETAVLPGSTGISRE